MVGRDQREQQWVRSRICWVVPVVDNYICLDSATQKGGVASFPFILPPFQESFSSDYVVASTTPEVYLDELQFSFDQRGEGALITSNYNTAGGGKIDYDSLDDFKIVLSIDEKVPNVVQSSSATDHTYLATREIASIELDGTSIMDRKFRLNPIRVPVSRALNPYRTYVARLRVVNLVGDVGGTRYRWDLPGFQITVVIKTPLVTKDLGTVIQNLPTVHATGGRSAETVALTLPAADDPIIAGDIPSAQTTGAGVAANLLRFENLFRDKLAGGVHKDGAWPLKEHLLEDSGYEVIVVPMWSNIGSDREIRSATADLFPYSSTTAGADYIQPNGVRQFLVLDYPLVIHHCYAVVNYTSMRAAGLHPTSATFFNIVSVELGSGLRSDFAGYETVAGLQWTPATKANHTVDRILEFENTSRVASNMDWSHELINIPIVGHGIGPTTNGDGFFDQGKPCYVGKATDRYVARQDVAGIAPRTEGREQFLEFRWIIHDAHGLSFGANGACGDADEVLVGHGGHYIVLICKKMSVGGLRDVLV
tara:strand:+ start:14819 stop:16426 length:1608 start_codon:yes stop_codon:yes gene_type:complete